MYLPLVNNVGSSAPPVDKTPLPGREGDTECTEYTEYTEHSIMLAISSLDKACSLLGRVLTLLPIQLTLQVLTFPLFPFSPFPRGRRFLSALLTPLHLLIPLALPLDVRLQKKISVLVSSHPPQRPSCVMLQLLSCG